MKKPQEDLPGPNLINSFVLPDCGKDSRAALTNVHNSVTFAYIIPARMHKKLQQRSVTYSAQALAKPAFALFLACILRGITAPHAVNNNQLQSI